MSAQFVSDPSAVNNWESTAINGVTMQLIGEPWLHAKPFAYCGNIGPIELPRLVQANVWWTAILFAQPAKLRGLWGLDFIFNEETVYPVELNPRYTAAVEVLELSLRCSFLWTHHRCFTGSCALGKYKTWQRWDSTVGKAIYFAPHRITFPRSGPWDADLAGEFDPKHVPQFADIPEPGSVIEPGWPVLSFFATGSTPEECRDRLQSRAAELDRLFEESTT